MHRAMHLLIMIGVLLCGLHFCATAEAHDDAPRQGMFSAPHDSGDNGAPDPAKLAHGTHHHCPVAPDPDVPARPAAALPPESAFFARPAAPMHSLSRAPPIEPPAA